MLEKNKTFTDKEAREAYSDFIRRKCKEIRDRLSVGEGEAKRLTYRVEYGVFRLGKMPLLGEISFDKEEEIAINLGQGRVTDNSRPFCRYYFKGDLFFRKPRYSLQTQLSFYELQCLCNVLSSISGILSGEDPSSYDISKEFQNLVELNK